MAMTDTEITQIVRELLNGRFGQLGLRGATVKSDVDFDGAPIIRVTATFDNRDVTPSALTDALHELRSKLIERGEDRFVFLDATFPQDEYLHETDT